MTEAKFLAFALSVTVSAGLFTPIGGRMTLAMAKAAISAQQRQQLSYGAFSKQLWFQAHVARSHMQKSKR